MVMPRVVRFSPNAPWNRGYPRAMKSSNRFGGNDEDGFERAAVYGGMGMTIAFDTQWSDEASRNGAFREASERNTNLGRWCLP